MGFHIYVRTHARTHTHTHTLCQDGEIGSRKVSDVFRYLTCRGPCIVIYSYNKTNMMH